MVIPRQNKPRLRIVNIVSWGIAEDPGDGLIENRITSRKTALIEVVGVKTFKRPLFGICPSHHCFLQYICYLGMVIHALFGKWYFLSELLILGVCGKPFHDAFLCNRFTLADFCELA